MLTEYIVAIVNKIILNTNSSHEKLFKDSE